MGLGYENTESTGLSESRESSELSESRESDESAEYSESSESASESIYDLWECVYFAYMKKWNVPCSFRKCDDPSYLNYTCM